MKKSRPIAVVIGSLLPFGLSALSAAAAEPAAPPPSLTVAHGATLTKYGRLKTVVHFTCLRDAPEPRIELLFGSGDGRTNYVLLDRCTGKPQVKTVYLAAQGFTRGRTSVNGLLYYSCESHETEACGGMDWYTGPVKII